MKWLALFLVLASVSASARIPLAHWTVVPWWLLTQCTITSANLPSRPKEIV